MKMYQTWPSYIGRWITLVAMISLGSWLIISGLFFAEALELRGSTLQSKPAVRVIYVLTGIFLVGLHTWLTWSVRHSGYGRGPKIVISPEGLWVSNCRSSAPIPWSEVLAVEIDDESLCFRLRNATHHVNAPWPIEPDPIHSFKYLDVPRSAILTELKKYTEVRESEDAA